MVGYSLFQTAYTVAYTHSYGDTRFNDSIDRNSDSCCNSGLDSLGEANSSDQARIHSSFDTATSFHAGTYGFPVF